MPGQNGGVTGREPQKRAARQHRDGNGQDRPKHVSRAAEQRACQDSADRPDKPRLPIRWRDPGAPGQGRLRDGKRVVARKPVAAGDLVEQEIAEPVLPVIGRSRSIRVPLVGCRTENDRHVEMQSEQNFPLGIGRLGPVFRKQMLERFGIRGRGFRAVAGPDHGHDLPADLNVVVQLLQGGLAGFRQLGEILLHRDPQVDGAQ